MLSLYFLHTQLLRSEDREGSDNNFGRVKFDCITWDASKEGINSECQRHGSSCNHIENESGKETVEKITG